MVPPVGAAPHTAPSQTIPASTEAASAQAPSPEGAPASSAPAGPSSGQSGLPLVPILASVIALLVGLGGGYILGRDAGMRDARTVAAAQEPTQAPAAPTQAPTQPTQAPAQPTEAPTISEEQMQQIIEARRAVPNRDPEDPMAIGEVDAPVVMVEFADYRCGYCGRFALETQPNLMPLVEDGTLRIEFRDFPIFQEESVDAAIAARAAARQGMFIEYHNEIYSYQFAEGGQDLSEATWIMLAERVGIPDIEQFTADLADPQLRSDVDAAYQEALEIVGRPSTPQFVINDEYVGGADTTENFLAVIQSELEKVQG